MSTVHDAPGASVPGEQWLAPSEKSPALGPVSASAVIASGWSPVWLSVSVCLSSPPWTIRAPKASVETSNPLPGPGPGGVLGDEAPAARGRGGGLDEGRRAAAVPVPVSAMTSGEPVELLAGLSEADLAPVVVGWKRTPMTHVPPGATGGVQPLDAMANWSALVPPTVAAPGVTAPCESLVNVTFCVALGELVSWLPKASDA